MTVVRSLLLRPNAGRRGAARTLAAASGQHPRTVREVEERVAANARNSNEDDEDGAPAAALNFSLSGTGPAFFSWMAGFCHGLQSRGLVTKESNLVGLSGGALCSVLLAAGADFSETGDVMSCGQEQSDRCRDGTQGVTDKPNDAAY